MLVYGLSGAIASGKSTVATFFQQVGIPVFDADKLGHEVLETNHQLAHTITERLPDCARPEDRGIDRAKLGAKVFANSTIKTWLEDLLHPAIYQNFKNQIECIPSPRPKVCLLEGAVLLESRTCFNLAGLIMVIAPLRIRIKRLRKRDGFSNARIQSRIQSQLPQHTKILSATHLINNSGTLEQTQREVQAVVMQLAEEIGFMAPNI